MVLQILKSARKTASNTSTKSENCVDEEEWGTPFPKKHQKKSQVENSDDDQSAVSENYILEPSEKLRNFYDGLLKKTALNKTIRDYFNVRDIDILVAKVMFPNATDNESVKQLKYFSCKKVKDLVFSPQIRPIQEDNSGIVQQGSKTALYLSGDENVLGTEAASGGVSFDPSEFSSPTDAATTSPSTETTKI
jgi:hypothetical protein